MCSGVEDSDGWYSSVLERVCGHDPSPRMYFQKQVSGIASCHRFFQLWPQRNIKNQQYQAPSNLDNPLPHPQALHVNSPLSLTEHSQPCVKQSEPCTETPIQESSRGTHQRDPITYFPQASIRLPKAPQVPKVGGPKEGSYKPWFLKYTLSSALKPEYRNLILVSVVSGVPKRLRLRLPWSEVQGLLGWTLKSDPGYTRRVT